MHYPVRHDSSALLMTSSASGGGGGKSRIAERNLNALAILGYMAVPARGFVHISHHHHMRGQNENIITIID